MEIGSDFLLIPIGFLSPISVDIATSGTAEVCCHALINFNQRINMKNQTILFLLGTFSLLIVNGCSIPTIAESEFVKSNNLVQANCKVKSIYGYNFKSDVSKEFWGRCNNDGFAEGKGIIFSKNYSGMSVDMNRSDTQKSFMYQGEFKSGLPDGEGELQINGTKYKTDPKLGIRIPTDPGIEVIDYKGQFRDGLPNGFGTEYASSIKDYTEINKTEFVDKRKTTVRKQKSMREGWKSVVYKGNWKNGKKSYGTQYFNYCDRYIGPFRNDKPEGVGTYVFATQELVKKTASSGSVSTQIMFKKGFSYTGRFTNGKVDSDSTICEIVFSDGSNYRGSCKDASPNGEGFLVRGGKVTYGIWKNGKIIKKMNNNNKLLSNITQLNKLFNGGISKALGTQIADSQVRQMSFLATILGQSIGVIDECKDPYASNIFDSFVELNELYRNLIEFKETGDTSKIERLREYIN